MSDKATFVGGFEFALLASIRLIRRRFSLRMKSLSRLELISVCGVCVLQTSFRNIRGVTVVGTFVNSSFGSTDGPMVAISAWERFLSSVRSLMNDEVVFVLVSDSTIAAQIRLFSISSCRLVHVIRVKNWPSVHNDIWSCSFLGFLRCWFFVS